MPHAKVATMLSSYSTIKEIGGSSKSNSLATLQKREKGRRAQDFSHPKHQVWFGLTFRGNSPLFIFAKILIKYF